MHESVKRIIDKWDPIDLLPYAPHDEYEIEARLVFAEMLTPQGCQVDPERLATRIREIFIRQFGDTVFKASHEECLVIAKEIIDQFKDTGLE